MAYVFDHLFAADPANPQNIARNSSITIFAVGDAAMTPVALKTVDGQPYPNPVTTNANGFAAKPVHESLDQLAWAGGGFTGTMVSYEGMKEEAVAARGAADNAAANAAAAAQADLEARIAAGEFKGEKGADGSNVLPTDTAIKQAIDNPASETRGALNATFVPKWKPNTAYALGDAVVNPSGDTVTAKTAFTSGATYSAANWNLSGSYALKADAVPMSFVGGIYLKLNGGWTIGLGDSLTDFIAHQRSHFEEAAIISDQKIARLGNAGVSGNTVQQMEARLDADVISKRPDRVIFLGGTNNMGTDLEAAKTSYRNILDRLTIAGIAVAIVSIPPQTASQAIRDNIATWNAWLSSEASRRGMPYIDIHSALADASGNFVPAYTTDNLHMTQAGAEVAARVEVAALANIWPAVSPVKLFTAADPASILPNPVFTDAGADGTPDGWVVSGAGTVGTTTILTDPAVVGNVGRLTRTATSGTLAYTYTASTGFAAGDTLEFACRFRANSDAVTYSFYCTASDSAFNLLLNQQAMSGWTANLDGFHTAYGRIKLPANTAKVGFVMHTSAGLGTVDFGQPTLRKITV